MNTKGRFHEGKYHGQGVYKFASGERYEGEFRNGKFHGHGVYTWAGGLRFEGTLAEQPKVDRHGLQPVGDRGGYLYGRKMEECALDSCNQKGFPSSSYVM